MAYLDEDGIPRESKGQERRNHAVSKAISELNLIQQELISVITHAESEDLRDDPVLSQLLEACCENLELCRQRCYMHFIF